MLHAINPLASVKISDPLDDTERTVDEGEGVAFTCTARGFHHLVLRW